MKKFVLIAISISFISSLAFTQLSTYEFLQIDPSARASALGGSFIGIKDDPNGLFYNPALIGTFSTPRASFTYLDHFMDINAGTLYYGQYFKGIGNISIGISYIDYGSFQRTDEIMNNVGAFSANDFAFTAGTAFHFDEDILIGLSAKYIHSSIAEYSSYALALDFGFLYEIASENLVIGGSILNIGSQFKTYAGTNEPLPLDIKFGITKKPEHFPAYLNIVFHKMNEGGSKIKKHFENITFGAEFLMSETLRLRLGYNNKMRREMKMGTSIGLAGISFGLGLLLNKYQIDYAYNSIGKNLDGLQRFSLGVNL